MTEEPPPSEVKTPWYFKKRTLVIALLSVGPLALPLLWFNPKFSATQKVIWTSVTLALTYFMTLYTIDSVNKIMLQLKDAGLIK